MNVRKNFEAVFLAAVVMVSFAAYATAQVPAHHAPKNVQASAAMKDANMQTVVVKAKRLTAAEKTQQA
jgi:hypothetical protein